MRKYRQWIGLCGAAALLAAALALPGLDVTAAPQKGKDKKKVVEPIDPFGEPKEFGKGELTGFAIWHGKKGWHLRTTTRKTEHHFKGHIIVEGGVLESVSSHDLEFSGKLADRWKVSDNMRELSFEFKTDRGIDGVNFKVSKEAKLIRFRLHFNGKEQLEHVWIGHEGRHPHHMPFELVAHGPGKKKT
jgi:hypothetical protein